jgi:nucleoside-diphosphate-sugar epimerase
VSLSGLSADRFDAQVVGRAKSYFADDVAANHARISAELNGQRVLVVGGGGSIGSSTIRQLLRYAPAAVHVIDHSENYLAELVRDIRSSIDLSAGTDLRMWPIDFGGAVAERLIRNEAAYDVVMNFAALKHVRSEKDTYSLMQMLDTNIVRQARFKEWIVARGGTKRFFGVSTDKAANPTSLMGATKRVMEDVLFGIAPNSAMTVTSARFANVLFSNGSLPQSWLRRIELGQPLAVPRDTRRYFVTRAESGEICLLASLLGASGEIFIPRLDPERELRLLEATACGVLKELGFEAEKFADEAEARRAVDKLRREKRWPLLMTPLDTSGEKPYEEFVGKGEQAHEIGMTGLLAIKHLATRVDGAFIDRLEALIGDPAAAGAKADIVSTLASVVPNLQHVETDRNLDQRM